MSDRTRQTRKNTSKNTSKDRGGGVKRGFSPDLEHGKYTGRLDQIGGRKRNAITATARARVGKKPYVVEDAVDSDSDMFAPPLSQHSLDDDTEILEIEKDLPNMTDMSVSPPLSSSVLNTQSLSKICGKGKGSMGLGFVPFQHGNADGTDEQGEDDSDSDSDSGSGSGSHSERESESESEDDDDDDGDGEDDQEEEDKEEKMLKKNHKISKKNQDQTRDSWILSHGIDGGPMNHELLSGFLGHIAHAIWNGDVRKVLTCHNRADRLQSWKIKNKDVRNLLELSQLAHLKDCMFQHINMPLISAFVERWQPETNSFHLPFGEMTITLHDVWFILGIPVKGTPIIFDMKPSDSKGFVRDLLGLTNTEVDKTWKSGTIKFKVIQDSLSLENKPSQSIAKGYLLWLLAGTLFVDKSQNGANAYFLPFLQDLDEVRNHSWGAAALSYLYRQLGLASRASTAQIAGCLTLLEAWIYEYFPIFRASMNNNWTKNMPYAQKWVTRSSQRSSDEALVSYRRRLDMITVDEVNWTPFDKAPHEIVPVTLFAGIIHCRNIGEPYMPDRVMRQFGYCQCIPHPPFKPRMVYRGKNVNKYKCEHESMLRLWETWQDHVVRITEKSFRARFATEAVGSYLNWFLERTHPHICKEVVDDNNEETSTNHHMTDTARLQYIGARLVALHPLVRPYTSDSQFWQLLDEVTTHMEDWMPGLHEYRPNIGGTTTDGRRPIRR